MSEIVAATGVGRNTFYGHFEDVRQVSLEVGRACLEEIETALTRLTPVGKTPHTATLEFAEGWYSFVRDQREAVLVAFRVDPEALRERLESSLRALHLVGANAGLFRRSLELERLRGLSALLLDGSVMVARGHGQVDAARSALVDAVVALCR